MNNRPANPAEISFAPECFETIPAPDVWVAVRLAPLYPLTFASLEAATAAGYPNAKRRAGQTTVRRVRWS